MPRKLQALPAISLEKTHVVLLIGEPSLLGFCDVRRVYKTDQIVNIISYSQATER